MVKLSKLLHEFRAEKRRKKKNTEGWRGISKKAVSISIVPSVFRLEEATRSAETS